MKNFFELACRFQEFFPFKDFSSKEDEVARYRLQVVQ